MAPTVSLIDETGRIAPADLMRVAKALALQLARDFAPAWGRTAILAPVSAMETPADGSWWISLVDDEAQAQALGRHGLTPEGLPLAQVLLSKAGPHWSETASHELLEMLVDPDLVQSVYREAPSGSAYFYALEVCDPCQGPDFAYAIDGATIVSDFVLPSWFESFTRTGAPVDFAKKLAAPFALGKGGYIGVFEPAGARRWTQLTDDGKTVNTDVHAHVGSRRRRREVAPGQRLRSAPHLRGGVR
jgi:hypothetical protein